MGEAKRRPPRQEQPGSRTTSSQRPLAAYAARLARWAPVAVLLDTWRRLTAHEASDLAATIAYYGLFSLFPLLLGVIALLSLFLDPAVVQRALVQIAGRTLPGTEEVVIRNVQGVLRIRGILGAASVLGLLWSGSAVFGALTRALDRAWGTRAPRPAYIVRARQLALALGAGSLFVVTLAASTFVHLAEEFSAVNEPAFGILRGVLTRWGLEAGSLVSSVGILALLYQFATTTHIPWRHLWPGAILGGLLFELAKNAFILYLSEFANIERVYGSVSSIIVLLLWAYISAFIVILGAEFGAAMGRWRQGEL